MASLKTCEDCERPSNNQYFNCPPRMSDGRHFTDYRPRCAQQYQDKITNKLMRSYDQRLYLTENAEEIMKTNARNSYMMNRCGPCVEPYDQGTMVPEFEEQTCDANTCSFSVNDPYGVGLGRKLYDHEADQKIKERFLEEKDKETKFFAQTAQCCGTPADDLQYYPIDGIIAKDYARTVIPSGATPMTGGDIVK